MEKWVSQLGQTMIMVELGVNFTCKNSSLELVLQPTAPLLTTSFTDGGRLDYFASTVLGFESLEKLELKCDEHRSFFTNRGAYMARPKGYYIMLRDSIFACFFIPERFAGISGHAGHD